MFQPSTKCRTTVDEPKFRRHTVPHSRSRDGKGATAKLRPRPDYNSRSGSNKNDQQLALSLCISVHRLQIRIADVKKVLH